MNRGGILNLILGDWTATTIQTLRTGQPVTFGMAGSPYRYLPGQSQPNIVPGQVVNVPNYAVGPNLWPQSNQNPWFNIGAFSYPGAFTGGNAGRGHRASRAESGGPSTRSPRAGLTRNVSRSPCAPTRTICCPRLGRS